MKENIRIFQQGTRVQLIIDNISTKTLSKLKDLMLADIEPAPDAEYHAPDLSDPENPPASAELNPYYDENKAPVAEIYRICSLQDGSNIKKWDAVKMYIVLACDHGTDTDLRNIIWILRDSISACSFLQEKGTNDWKEALSNSDHNELLQLCKFILTKQPW